MSSHSPAKWAEIYLRNGLIRFFSSFVSRRAQAPTAEDLVRSRVLLIRQDRIGDVLVSIPFIRVLRRRYPEMTIDILVSPNNAMSVDGIAGIRKRWIYSKSFTRIVLLLRSIRRVQYDVAVDLMDNPSATSTLLCFFAGARWTIGIEKENDYIYDVKARLRSRSDVHIVERIAELLEPFRIDPAKEELTLTYEPGPDALAAARQICMSRGLHRGNALCVNISAGSMSREWGEENYVVLIRSLEQSFPDRPIVVASAERDSRLAASIAGKATRATILPHTKNFQTFAACLKYMGIIVTPDTAVVHLAAAFHIPSVILYIQVDPDLMIWEPYKTPHEALISHEDSLAPISPDAVLQAVISVERRTRMKVSRRPVKKR